MEGNGNQNHFLTVKFPKCRTKFCRGIVLPTSHSPYCGKCRSRRFSELHPLKYAYGKLKHRAIERGHAFELTFEQFSKFAIETGWLEKKGKTAQSLSINRIRNHEGYHVGNIEAVTLSWNSKLQFAPIPDWMKENIKTETHNTPPDEP